MRDMRIRIAGAWLAIASVLLVGVLIFHGSIDPDMGGQMQAIADAPDQWAIVHWAAAASLSLIALASLIVLTGQTRLTEAATTVSAWGVLAIGALWTVTTAVAEATVIADLAAVGDARTYASWWAFAEGKANGFAFLALAVAAIAINEARDARRATPAWASWIASVAGTAAFVGWGLGMWLGIALGSLVWVMSTIVMSLWTLWFGLGLARSKA